MRRFEDVQYYSGLEEVKPDANVIVRFVTEFLTEINQYEIQTTHGVITLPEKQGNPKLIHNDKIMVLGRQLQNNKFESTNITKITPTAYHLFKQYVQLLRRSTPIRPTEPQLQSIQQFF